MMMSRGPGKSPNKSCGRNGADNNATYVMDGASVDLQISIPPKLAMMIPGLLPSAEKRGRLVFSHAKLRTYGMRT